MRLTHCLLLLALTLPVVVLASPSGLNNIPTADTCPSGLLVLQAYSSSQSDAKTALMAGAKYGLRDYFEVGVDHQFAPEGATGPLQLQAKKAWWTRDLRTGFAAGLAGITDDWNEHPVYPYAVVSHRVGDRDRVHGGLAPQQDAFQWFAGYDYTLPCNTMLRTDLVRDTDNNVTKYSLGALVPTKFGALEGWVTRRDATSNDTILTLKVDYAFQP